MLGILALTLLASCYSWIGRYQTIQGKETSAHRPYVDASGRHFWYVDISARNENGSTEGSANPATPPAAHGNRRENYVNDLFSCRPVVPVVWPRDHLTPVERAGAPPVDLGAATAGTLVFRLGLISDVHIRQPSVKLFSDVVSRDLDAIINSFERNGYEEAFSTAVFAATIAAFNQLGGDLKPRVVINTGDATDAGTIEEAYDFVSVMHHLRYPMLYALGNHDDAIFGNYKKELGYTKDAGPTFFPIGQRPRFLTFFDAVPVVAGFNEQRLPTPLNYPSASLNARWGVVNLKRENDPAVELEKPHNACTLSDPRCDTTHCSGFDLGPRPPSYSAPADGHARCEEYPGYYSVVVPGSDPDPGSPSTTVQLIALNTTREQAWGQDAAFDDGQRAWLQQQLQQPATVTIVFMHHRPSAVPGLLPILNEVAARRPTVALSAHDHSHAMAWLGHLWEVNTGSLEEFPQWGRLIEIRQRGGRTYLNARTLRPQLPVLAAPPDLTAAGVGTGAYPDHWDTQGAIDRRLIGLGGNPADIAARAARLKRRQQLESWFEAQFARCDVIAARAPGQCARGEPAALEESAQCGYLGALYDHLMVGASGQSGAEASRQANVAVDISP